MKTEELNKKGTRGGRYIDIKCPDVNCDDRFKVYEFATVSRKCASCGAQLYKTTGGKIKLL